jgi:hypothetical protein
MKVMVDGSIEGSLGATVELESLRIHTSGGLKY